MVKAYCINKFAKEEIFEENVFKNENTEITWDGSNYPIDNWNKDQTVKTLVKNSVVWGYQDASNRLDRNIYRILK